MSTSNKALEAAIRKQVLRSVKEIQSLDEQSNVSVMMIVVAGGRCKISASGIDESSAKALLEIVLNDSDDWSGNWPSEISDDGVRH